MKKIFKITTCLLLITLSFGLFVSTVAADYKLPGYGTPVSCGNISNIPPRIPQVVSGLINIVQVIIPVLMVIFGAIDLLKAIYGKKEDEIKEGKNTLFKRIVVGSLIFVIVLLAKFFINIAVSGQDNSENKRSIISCIDCFVNNVCEGGGSSGGETPGGSPGATTNHRVAASGFTFDVPAVASITFDEYTPAPSDPDRYNGYVITDYPGGWIDFSVHYPDGGTYFYVNSGFDESRFDDDEAEVVRETITRSGKNFEVYYYTSYINNKEIDIYYQYDSSSYIYASIQQASRSRHLPDQIDNTILIMLSARK